MKDVLTVFTFSTAAACFVIFLAVFKPTDLSVVASANKHIGCDAAPVTLRACHPGGLARTQHRAFARSGES